MTQNAAGRGRKSSFRILKMNDSEKWGTVFKLKAQGVKRKAGNIGNLTFRRIAFPGYKKKKPPSINRGFFRELEFKVFFRTVNQAGFSGIFGYFSDIGYIKYIPGNKGSQAHNSSFCIVKLRLKPKAQSLKPKTAIEYINIQNL